MNLRESSQSFEILEGIPDGLVTVDEDFRFNYANREAERLLRAAREELCGKSCWDLFNDVIGTIVEHQLRRAVREQVTTEFEYYYGRFQAWFWARASPYAGGLLIAIRDVTAIKEAQEDLRRSREQSESRLAELETIYAEAPIGLCVFSPDLRYLRINERLAEINGLPAAEHLGRTIDEVVPALAAQAREILERVIQTRRPVQFDVRGETPALPGEERIWHEVWYPQWAQDGSLACVSVVAEEITESHRARTALGHSQALLQAFLDQLPVGAGLMNVDGRWLIRNEVLSQWVGESIPSRDAANGWRWEAWNPDGTVMAPKEYPGARALRGEHVAGTDFLYTGADGRQRWIRVSASPFRAPSGEITGAVCVAQDVDTQKRTERALSEFSETFRFHVENTPLALVELAQPDYRITRWSRRAQEVFGWTPEEMLGRPVATTGLIFEEDAANVARLNAAMLAGQELTNVHQNRNCAKDGSVRMMRWYNSARLDAAGKLTSVLALGLDVTNQVESERALAASEMRFRRLIEQSIFGVAIGDLSGNITYFNDAFLKIVGYRREDLNDGVGLRWNEMTPPEWTPLDERALAELHETGLATPYEKEYFRKDGRRVPILMGLATLDGSLAESPEILGFFMDLTEIKRVQRELERSNDELQRFVYTASHDLQEPIRTVTSFTQLLERRGIEKLDKDLQQYIGYILQASERMSRLIASLLEYSRAGFQGAPRMEAVDLGKVLSKVERVMGSTIEESGATVTHEPLPEVMGDESQIMQVLQNLIGNAIKYRQSGETARVHLSAARCEGPEWQISVKDNGIGFDLQDGGRIFGVFQRLHGPKVSGSGLGLAICRRIVENHGGRIWAESSPGVGSTFYFTVPAAAERD